MSNFSDKLHSAPFIRLLVPFIAGIVLGDPFRPEQKWYFFGLSLLFSLLLIFFRKASFKRQPIFGILLFSSLIFLGIFTATNLKYTPPLLPAGDYFAVIDEFPVKKEKTYRAVIRMIDPEIKVIAYFEKSDRVANAEPGTVIWLSGKPELLQKTGNPFEFDYQAYAIRNHIGHRIYLKNNNIYFLKAEKERNISDWSLIIRDRLLKILEKSGMKGEVLHLVSAISLGAREELEPETTRSFSKTGVIHVLAVSGMNVGLIYVVLDLLMGFLKRRKWGIILHTLFIITVIWGYALITGMSASVLRAAAMFSFIVVGNNLSRHPNIYNSLAASAFVLLCFNPSLVYDVGFQLSYAAVFSIIYFHPFLYGLLYFKYWIPNQIWILLTVSFAAQIGTVPFLLHYFHQFPTWFLLANLMVIPLVTLILYLTFIVFAIAPVLPFLGILMAKILEWAGQGMLFSVHFVEQLPYSILDNLYPTDFVLFLVVLISIFMSLFFVYKSPKALIASLMLIVTFLIFNILSTHKTLTQKEVVVFNISGKTLAALTFGAETIWLTTEKSEEIEKMKYYTHPYEGFRGIRKSLVISLSDSSELITGRLSQKENFMNFKGLTLCMLYRRDNDIIDWKHFPDVDMIIVSETSLTDLVLIRKYLPNTTIIENRAYYKLSEESQKQMEAISKTKFMNTSKGGAVQILFSLNANEGKTILYSKYFNQ